MVIVYIESGFLPIKAVALMRQLKFYERFFDTVEENSRRDKMLKFLTEEENRTAYIQNYQDLHSGPIDEIQQQRRYCQGIS